MKYIISLLVLCGCMPHDTSIDDVIEKSMKQKEGVDIQITPIKEKKQ